MVIYWHVGYPLALDQVHAQAMQSLQVRLHKHSNNFKRVRGYLLPHVKSLELTQIVISMHSPPSRMKLLIFVLTLV